MDDRELLVVLRPGHHVVTQGSDVVHQVSPEVMVVRVPPGSTIQSRDEVGVVYAGVDPPPEVLADLDPNERLFVEGWLTKRATAKTDRPGEGLPWDAPGMTPPDPPPENADHDARRAN